jgi:hypothetical protein
VERRRPAEVAVTAKHQDPHAASLTWLRFEAIAHESAGLVNAGRLYKVT